MLISTNAKSVLFFFLTPFSIQSPNFPADSFSWRQSIVTIVDKHYWQLPCHQCTPVSHGEKDQYKRAHRHFPFSRMGVHGCAV